MVLFMFKFLAKPESRLKINCKTEVKLHLIVHGAL